MKTNPNDPAMAGNEYDHGQFNPGLTKREYFAAMAMQGIIAKPATLTTNEKFAAAAVSMADALIAALNETSTSKQ